MSADDELFAPLEPWLDDCRAITRYIQNHRFQPVSRSMYLRPGRPDSALTLEQLCRLYYRDGQRAFYVVIYHHDVPFAPFHESFVFDGKLVFDLYEDWGCPHIRVYPTRSIRDLNLVENAYNSNYVFASPVKAQDYYNEV